MSETIGLGELLGCLAGSAEKAARIARLFRGADELPVEDKPQLLKQRQMVRDYKTLADVLVQEAIKRDVAQRFPALLPNIQGEEQTSFKSSSGETVRLELPATQEETAAMLRLLMVDHRRLTDVLASAAHQPPPEAPTPTSPSAVPADAIGVWIDPIDSTVEYIQGKDEATDCYGIQHNGLKCVCVLIGAYDLRTGVPFLGVVSQPFFSRDPTTSEWESRLYWAIHWGSESALSPTLSPPDPPPAAAEKIAVLSSFEDRRLVQILRTRYRTVYAAGAGHKALLVARGIAHLYVLSMGTTYFWDTCGPHALLAAQGGGVVRFGRALAGGSVEESQVRYLMAGGSRQNSDGFVAYRDPGDVSELVDLLKENGYDVASQKSHVQ